MKRFLLVLGLSLALFAASPLALAQAKYTIKVNGKAVGTASLTQTLLPGGEKVVQSRVEMASGANAKVFVTGNSRYDSRGNPLRQFIETITVGPASRRQVTATFDATGAHAIVDESGVRKVVDVPLVDTAPRADPTQFWALRTPPKAGTRVQFYRFDAVLLKWNLTTAIYVGQKEVAYGKAKIKVHVINDDRAVTWVDERGLPVRIELDGSLLERIEPN
ncbi:MAG: hypothetical protein HZC36_11390 [Armatimonadetes bacterium]|nr:hypothetical protein [Armatimonadota bacterium]